MTDDCNPGKKKVKSFDEQTCTVSVPLTLRFPCSQKSSN